MSAPLGTGRERVRKGIDKTDGIGVRVRVRDKDRDSVYRDVVVDHVDAPVEDEAVDVRAQRRLGRAGVPRLQGHLVRVRVRVRVGVRVGIRVGVGVRRRVGVGGRVGV